VSTPASYNVPALTTATATGPTTGQVTIDPPNTPVQPTSYTVTLVPVGGGSPITVTCANPDDCPIPGLAPDTTYTVTAVGNLPGGGTTPASGTASLTTPPTSGPAPIKITDTNATSPYAGTVVIAPPAGTQPTNYTVILTPVDGGPTITVTCTTPASCPVTGLDPGSTYLVGWSGGCGAGAALKWQGVPRVAGWAATGARYSCRYRCRYTAPQHSAAPTARPAPPLQVSATGNLPDGTRTNTAESSLVTPDAPEITSATADSPTTAIVGIEPPTDGPLPTSYTVTLTPVGGGSPITVTSPTPVVDFSGLAPGTTYAVTAVATLPGGAVIPVEGSPTVSTPAGPTSPALTTATPTGPTTGSVTIEPPASGPQPTSYTVTVTPVGGGSPIVVTCVNPDDCPVTGLTPDTTYTVTAVGNLPGGGTTPASGTASITTPDDGSDSQTASPAITDSRATSPTAGTVVIAPPAEGPLPTNYTVTLTPVGGGSPITVTCSTPSSCPVPGLTPDTTYLVRALGAGRWALGAGAAAAAAAGRDGAAGHCARLPFTARRLCRRSPPRATTPTAPAPRPPRPAW
jgi:hypothetical protein